MATNRMFLLHVPSRNAVYLGKRMGWGWYDVPENIKQSLEKLFKLVEESHDQDHYPYGFDGWHYSNLGHDEEPRVLKFDVKTDNE